MKMHKNKSRLLYYYYYYCIIHCRRSARIICYGVSVSKCRQKGILLSAIHQIIPLLPIHEYFCRFRHQITHLSTSTQGADVPSINDFINICNFYSISVAFCQPILKLYSVSPDSLFYFAFS